MINWICYNEEGHKVGRPVRNREGYFEIRNSAANKANFLAARSGDDQAKRKLAQFAYNDQLPDGILAGCHTASSTFSHDIDCHDEKECKEIAKRIMEHREQLHLLELSVSPNWGLHAVCKRTLGKTVLENQIHFSMIAQTEMDCNAHDGQRIMFTGPADPETLLFLDDSIFDEPLSVEEGQQEYLRLQEREKQGLEELPTDYKKGEKHYKPCASGACLISSEAPRDLTNESPTEGVAEVPEKDEIADLQVFDHSVLDYINTMLPDGVPQGQRHAFMLKLSNDLIILLDNDVKRVKKAVIQIEWVKNWLKEQGAEREVDDIIDSAKKLLKKRESESFYTIRPSKNMVVAIETVTRQSYNKLTNTGNEVTAKGSDEQVQMLQRMGQQIKKFNKDFPLLKLMCNGLKPIHYVAAMFVGASFTSTLMTRCWYSFYGAAGKKCRLNSLVMVIGRPGSGKRFAVNLYNLLMEPVKKADKAQIDALNAWNQEREKNNGASKSSTPRPTGTLRCLPAETSAAAIREAEFNAKEVIDGEEWPLHVNIFDSELNNTLSLMKKSHLDAFKTLWLKSFHSEAGGALLKTSSSPVGEFPIHFNACYTGTYDAFEQIATDASYNSGTTSRFACVPMGPTGFEMMEYREQTVEDKLVEQQLREWAYKLDAAVGEIPTTPLSKALWQWTARKMDEAREEQSEVLEEMCKRPAWVGINHALPFIITRHWGEMVQGEDGKFRCGPDFHLDKKDIDLAVFIAQAHYDFQQYFFYELGQKQFDKQAEKKYGKKLPSRTQLAFKRLPEVFTSSDVMREYGYENSNSVNSCLKRLQDDGRVKKIRTGEDKGKYRKVE